MANFLCDNCAGCGLYDLKRNMHAIFTPSSKGSSYNPKILCFFCEGCFANFLERYEIDW